MRMRLSLYLSPQTAGPHQDAEIVDAVVEQAIEATHAGFASVCLTEHHVSDANTYGNNFMLGCYLAPQIHPSAYVVMAVAVPPMHNPLRLAQQINLLDLLTKGRCIVGFGPGGVPMEYAGFGLNPSQRAELAEETLAVTLQALAKRPEDPPFSYQTATAHGELRNRVMPASYRPGGPLFARGTLSDEGIKDAARRGWLLFSARATAAELGEKWRLYRAELEATGHTPAQVEACLDWSIVQKICYIADTDEQALAEVQAPIDRMEAGVRSQGLDTSTGNAELAAFLKSVRVMPSDRQSFMDRVMVVGSPDTVAAQIQAHADRGIRHLALMFLFGMEDPAKIRDRFRRLFLKEVLPRFAPSATNTEDAPTAGDARTPALARP